MARFLIGLVLGAALAIGSVFALSYGPRAQLAECQERPRSSMWPRLSPTEAQLLRKIDPTR